MGACNYGDGAGRIRSGFLSEKISEDILYKLGNDDLPWTFGEDEYIKRLKFDRANFRSNIGAIFIFVFLIFIVYRFLSG